MKNEKLVFYDHNCKICTCFSNWVMNRTSYWKFLPNDYETFTSKSLNLDYEKINKKIICIDDNIFYGAIAILKIYTKCGGVLSSLSSFFISLKFFYPLYFFGYYLLSKNRSRFSFLIKYLDC